MPSREEQAKHSLSGKPCKSIKGSVAKPAFPQPFRDAITSNYNTFSIIILFLFNNIYVLDFIMAKWEQWHKVPIAKSSIGSAISAKLVNSHSHTIKSQQKGTAAINEDEYESDGEDDNNEIRDVFDGLGNTQQI